MIPLINRFRSSLARLAAVVCFVSPLFADIVTLVDGTELEGEIVTQTEDLLILRTKVGGIWDERRLQLGEVRSIERESPEAKAWREAKVSLPTPDLLPRADYEEMINESLKPFLNEYPSGEYTARAREQLAVLEDELEKVLAGDIKFNGDWMSADEYEDRKYWVDSERIFRDLESSAERGSLVTALRHFHDLETNYADSIGYALAVPEIRSVLEKYDRELTTAIIRAPRLVEQRMEMLDTLPAAERKQTKREIELSDEEAKARVEKERADDVKWITPYPYDENLLKSIQSTVRKEMERIAELEPSVLERRAGVLALIDRTINEGRLEKAQELIAEHNELLRRSDYLRNLENKLKELIKEREQAATIETTDPEVDEDDADTDGGEDGEEKPEGKETGEEKAETGLSDAEKRSQALNPGEDQEEKITKNEGSPESDEEAGEEDRQEQQVEKETAGTGQVDQPAESPAETDTAEEEDEEGINPILLGVLIMLVLILVGALVANAKGKRKMNEKE